MTHRLPVQAPAPATNRTSKIPDILRYPVYSQTYQAEFLTTVMFQSSSKCRTFAADRLVPTASAALVEAVEAVAATEAMARAVGSGDVVDVLLKIKRSICHKPTSKLKRGRHLILKL